MADFENSSLAAKVFEQAAEIATLQKRVDELTARCHDCHGTGTEYSGVCHCGESMDSAGFLAHDGHTPVEMTRECQRCTAVSGYQKPWFANDIPHKNTCDVWSGGPCCCGAEK